jgi:hypothetical protein
MPTAPGAAGPGAPFPQWTISEPGYVLGKVSNATEKGLAETAVYPGRLIFFTSEKAARAYALSKGHGAIVSPATKVGGQKALDVGTQAAQDVLGGFDIGAWFLRVGEILLGLVLIGVGVARITGAQNAISKIVKTKVPI